MYAWIWRHLPFGLPGKIAGSLLLVGTASALLWYVVFPAIEPMMSFLVDGQVTADTTEPSGDVPSGGTDPSAPPSDVIPYSTTQNNPSPRPSR